MRTYLSYLIISSVLFSASFLFAGDDLLTVNGKEYTLGKIVQLFNGKDLKGWTTGKGDPVTKGWLVEEGVLTLKEPKSGDIYTQEHFSDFVLDFEWKNGEKCNSGIKYKMFRPKNAGWLGLEYQIQDDLGYDFKPESRQATGGLFDVFGTTPDKIVKPLGEYNSGRIVVCGKHVEHWLNGRKVLEFTIDSDEWNEAKAKSKFKNNEMYGPVASGPIMLQDHGFPVWFRKVELRKLSAK